VTSAAQVVAVALELVVVAETEPFASWKFRRQNHVLRLAVEQKISAALSFDDHAGSCRKF
jgi:hypothetical protein